MILSSLGFGIMFGFLSFSGRLNCTDSLQIFDSKNATIAPLASFNEKANDDLCDVLITFAAPSETEEYFFSGNSSAIKYFKSLEAYACNADKDVEHEFGGLEASDSIVFCPIGLPQRVTFEPEWDNILGIKSENTTTCGIDYQVKVVDTEFDVATMESQEFSFGFPFSSCNDSVQLQWPQDKRMPSSIYLDVYLSPWIDLDKALEKRIFFEEEPFFELYSKKQKRLMIAGGVFGVLVCLCLCIAGGLQANRKAKQSVVVPI